VLERNDRYWGEKPRLARVTVQIIKDPSARVAAIQSGQIDCTVNVPVREVMRFAKEPGFAAELNPITRVILLQVRPVDLRLKRWKVDGGVISGVNARKAVQRAEGAGGRVR
jgi:ABC-type transport system substrate-binding protein